MGFFQEFEMKTKINYGKMLAALLAVIALCLTLFLPFGRFGVRVQAEETGKVIDVFLLAGQSNAAGYTQGTRKLGGTFENVSYAGETDIDRKTGVASSSYMTYPFKTEVTEGLGRTTACMGPEYGIAEALNESYGEGHKALIFKTASGGTGLRNSTGGQNDDFGNWYPRSKWTGEANASSSPMGVMYKRFVDNFKTVYDQLVAEGYAPRVQGMAWMQGEADLDAPNEYQTLLEVFIKDIRADLVTVTGDDELSEMPFVIGEIATSFAVANNPQVPPFIEAQRAVAEKMTNVFTVKTDDLIIVDDDGTVYGSDQYHFNKADMRTLGMRFGNVLLENLRLEDIYLSAGEGGTVDYAFNAEKTQLTLTVTPDSGFCLKSLKVDNAFVTEEVENGTYTVQNPRKGVTVEAKFAPIPVAIEYRFEAEQGSVTGPQSVERGAELAVTVCAAEGYEIESVKLGTQELTFRLSDGRYVLDGVTEAGTVEVTFRKKEKPKEGLSGGAIAGIAVGCIAVIGAAVAAVVIVKKKKK